MISNQKTLERVKNLEGLIMRELQGFQLASYTEIPETGIINLPIFGLRFKFIDTPQTDDDFYQLIHIPNEDFFDPDKLFIILCTKGYMHWIRQQMGTHAFMMVLSYKDRWRLLVEAAIEKAYEDKKGEYLISYFESFFDRPFETIYHEDPSVFDWMVV